MTVNTLGSKAVAQLLVAERVMDDCVSDPLRSDYAVIFRLLIEGSDRDISLVASWIRTGKQSDVLSG